jgi:hypothetical protein
MTHSWVLNLRTFLCDFDVTRAIPQPHRSQMLTWIVTAHTHTHTHTHTPAIDFGAPEHRQQVPYLGAPGIAVGSMMAPQGSECGTQAGYTGWR